MKIELKNVKHSEFASHETSCFEASVYIDGVRAGIVENDGQGGCNRYHPYDLEIKIDTYAKTLPPRQSKYSDLSYDEDADTVIGDLLTEHLYAKDLKRALAKKIMYVKTDDGLIYETIGLSKLELQLYLAEAKLCNKIHEKLKAKTILNILPFTEALSIYRSGGIHA
jgi:hypothetical protein